MDHDSAWVEFHTETALPLRRVNHAVRGLAGILLFPALVADAVLPFAHASFSVAARARGIATERTGFLSLNCCASIFNSVTWRASVFL